MTGITLLYVGGQGYFTFAMQHPLELDEGQYPRSEKEVRKGAYGPCFVQLLLSLCPVSPCHWIPKRARLPV